MERRRPPGGGAVSGERWHRVVELFDAAVERPLEERGRWLDEACGGDSDLRREVETMFLRRLFAQRR